MQQCLIIKHSSILLSFVLYPLAPGELSMFRGIQMPLEGVFSVVVRLSMKSHNGCIVHERARVRARARACVRSSPNEPIFDCHPPKKKGGGGIYTYGLLTLSQGQIKQIKTKDSSETELPFRVRIANRHQQSTASLLKRRLSINLLIAGLWNGSR